MADNKNIEVKKKALETFFGQLADLFSALKKIAPQHTAKIEENALKVKTAIAAGVQLNKVVVPFHARIKEFYVKYNGFVAVGPNGQTKKATREQIFQKVLQEGIVLANEHEGSDQGLDKIWAKLNPQTQQRLSEYFFVLVKCSETLCGPVAEQQRVIDQVAAKSPQVDHQRNVDPPRQQIDEKGLQEIKHFIARLSTDAKTGKLQENIGSLLPDDKDMAALAAKLTHDMQTGNVPDQFKPSTDLAANVVMKFKAQEEKRRSKGAPPKSFDDAFSEMVNMVVSDAMKVQPPPVKSAKQSIKASSLF